MGMLGDDVPPTEITPRWQPGRARACPSSTSPPANLCREGPATRPVVQPRQESLQPGQHLAGRLLFSCTSEQAQRRTCSGQAPGEVAFDSRKSIWER